MSFSVGIVGLPNVGKSTLFKALTKKEVNITPRPFTTINPNFGRVPVPDQRLNKLADIIKPEETTPTIIEFIDIAGLVKGAHKGEGLGNQFLAQIRSCDAVLEVVRAFENQKVENVLGEINPEKEVGVIKTELLMKDLEILENTILKLDKKKDKNNIKKIEVLKKIKEGVQKGILVSEINLTEEENEEIKEYQYLTEKPVLFVLNNNKGSKFNNLKLKHLTIDLREEKEISELSDEDRNELGLTSHLDKLIVACYDILNLITFFTVTGGKEVRASTITKDSTAPEAGGVVHSDFEKKFIRADVINWQELVNSGSWSKAREKGLIKTVGKNYLVQDGDVIEFKI
jgi:GTP-binding protein YchF